MDDDHGRWQEASAAPQDDDQASAAAGLVDETTSQPFVGRWNQLVSSTNWEKGRIICEWREAMQQSDAPPADFSDEAWSRRVGGVTGQHVGRLRRVYRRFADTQTQFPGLYWSHFFAALEWDDAEMWLEGAVRNAWSVSQLRRTRWETLGAVEADKPQEADVVQGELDEDFEPALRASPTQDDAAKATKSSDKAHAANDDDLPVAVVDEGEQGDSSWEIADASANESRPRLRPFAELPELPDDLADAFEAFKLAILAHRGDGWQDVAAADVALALDALKQLALSPADEV